MNFIEFLTQTGDATVASLLGVVSQTVREWRRGKNCPRPVLAYKLIKLTDGKLSWDDIYNDYCQSNIKDNFQKHKEILQNVLEN